MKHLTAHRGAGWVLFPCLLLALQITLQGQQNCPPYPRTMDQVYVCCGSNAAFEQNASIHNPIRFTFGTFCRCWRPANNKRRSGIPDEKFNPFV
jgi:hypothetical protein